MNADARNGRGDRALLRTLVAGGGAQLAVVAGQLVSLPFVARSLSREEFGVYTSLATLVVLLGFADFGIGSSLITKLARAGDEDDALVRRRLVASGVAMTAVLALALLAVGVLAAGSLPWDQLLGADTMPASALESGATASAAVTACGVLGSLAHKILYGFQRGGTANLWLIAAAVAGSVGTIGCSYLGASVAVYLLAGPGSSALVSICCLVWLLSGRWAPTRRARLRDVHVGEAITIATSSGWFAVIAAAAALAYQTDTLIVAGALGAGSAGAYAVALRLFGVLRNAVYPALMQLWPAFAEALNRGDVAWVRKRLTRVVAVTAVSSGTTTLLLAALSPHIVATWLSPGLVASRSLYLAMAVWVTYGLAIAPYFYLLNALGLVRLHAVLTCLVAVVNVPVSLFLAYRLGLVGPLVGSLISHAILAGAPAVHVGNRALKEYAQPSRRTGTPCST